MLLKPPRSCRCPRFPSSLTPISSISSSQLPRIPQRLKKEVAAVAPNAMIDALRATVHQKRTENNAPTFSSTLVPTLDAYLGLRTGISGRKVDQYLGDAWVEDPDMTLRIIWNTRSIHDGKGEKELFYRLVSSYLFVARCKHQAGHSDGFSKITPGRRLRISIP